MGAEVTALALMKAAPGDLPALARAAAGLYKYRWVALTSARAVDALVEAVAPAAAERGLRGLDTGPPGRDPAERQGRGAAGEERRAEPRMASGPRWACVGPATAAALRRRLRRDADLVPERYDAASLAEAIVRADAAGHGSMEDGERKRVLFPSAAQARPELPRILQDAGYEVDQVTAYTMLPCPPAPARLFPGEHGPAGSWDAVVLTSGRAARVLLEALEGELGREGAREWMTRCRPATLGASAEEALREAGVQPAYRPRRPVAAELLAVLIEELDVGSCAGRPAHGVERGF